MLAEKRHGLYISGRYVQLFRLIQLEQEKINAKFNRRFNRNKNILQNVHDKNEALIIASKRKDDEKKSNYDDVNSNGNYKRKRQDYNKLSFKSDANAKKMLTRHVRFDQLKQDQANLFHYKDDKIWDVAKRMNRCIHHAHRGEWKKADLALGDMKLANIYQNDNLEKFKSKLPPEERDVYQFHTDAPQWQWDDPDDKLKMIKNQFRKLNKSAAPGLNGIDNKLLLWIIANDDNYDFIQELVYFIEQVMHSQFPEIVRKLFMFSSGMAIGKEKDGIFDHDVRPIIITNALIRLVDKIIMACHKEERRQLIGPYQLIGQKEALEKGMAQQPRCSVYEKDDELERSDAKK